MSGAAKRGALIVFEGCDRSGKTTQVKRLVETLNKRGCSTEMMRFPDRTTGIGSVINSYLTCSEELDDRAIHLLFSANRWEKVKQIQRRLAEGTNIIIDRYAFSGVAFSAAKPGLSLSWCKQPDVGLPRPDLVVFMDVTEEVAKQRGGFGEERYEVAEFQRRVRQNYKELTDETWVEICADGSLEEVEGKLLDIVNKELVKERGAVSRLWQASPVFGRGVRQRRRSKYQSSRLACSKE